MKPNLLVLFAHLLCLSMDKAVNVKQPLWSSYIEWISVFESWLLAVVTSC